MDRLLRSQRAATAGRRPVAAALASTPYGPAAGPQLRLITCGGTFDPSLGSYLSNVIVFAVAAS